MVIKGWDIGVASMKVGEKSLLYVRSDYGYGTHGRFLSSLSHPHSSILFPSLLFLV
jgi:FKBP-type peptidyl-prolyl cis-trans isomerase